MEISVLICTYNRADCISDILENLLSQNSKASFDYEIIVVDNNSNDLTKEVIESFLPRFQGKLRYFFESKQGKSHALNLGIRNAKGNIIAFTDDDCILEEDYLVNIQETFLKYGDEIGIAGGKIIPYWLNGSPPDWLHQFYPRMNLDKIPWSGKDKPAWLDQFFFGPLGILDYGPEAMIVDYGQDMPKIDFYGANIMIRRDLLDRHGFFSASKIVGEDTEICIRLFKLGVKGLYSPNIVVKHKIDVRKITPRHYYRRSFLFGLYGPSKVDFKIQRFYYPLGLPVWLIRKFLTLRLRAFVTRSFLQKVFYRGLAHICLGQLAQKFNTNDPA